MKKTLTTLLLFTALLALSQAPQKISYQAVARNASGTVLSNQPIGVKFIIYQGSIGGSTSYEETHTVTTNNFGLFSAFIGGGFPTAGNFTTINWANGPYFVETLIDPAGGTSYSSIGAQQLMSVPYALYAEKAGNASPPTIQINTPNTVTSNTATSSYTLNVPSYTAGSGISIASGVISNTAIATTPTITGLGLATVTPTTGNTFTVSVPNPTLSLASGSLSISNGNAVAMPVYSLTQTSNSITLIQNGLPIGTATLNSSNNGPWQQGVNTVSLTNVNDNVAIGTSTSSAKLSVENTNISNQALNVYQLPSSNSEGLYVENRGNSHTAVFETNNNFNSNFAVIASTNSSNGGALKAQNTSTTNTTEVLKVTQDGDGIGQIINLTKSSNNNIGLAVSTDGTGYAGDFISNGLTVVHAKTNSTAASAVAGIFDGGVISKSNSASTYAFQVQNLSSNQLLNVTPNGNVGIGMTSSTNGKLGIAHTSSSIFPHIDLVSPVNNFGRVKFSYVGSSNYFSIEGRSGVVAGKDDAISFSHYNGVNESQVLLINGDRRVYVNALNYPLSSFHVMTNSSFERGIISEGFTQAGEIILARNNSTTGARAVIGAAGVEIGRISFIGCANSTYPNEYAGSGPKITVVSTTSFNPSSQGAEMLFSTVPNFSATTQNVLRLTHDGKVQIINSLLIPTGAVNGNVLTSDAAGNASWQPAGSGLTGAGTNSVIAMWGAGNTLSNSPISTFTNTGGVLIKPSTAGSGSPATSLLVQGPLSGSTYVAQFLDRTSANTGIALSTQPLGGHAIGTLDNQDLGFFTNNTNVVGNFPMVLKTNGSVGIGTITPIAKLDIRSNSTNPTVLAKNINNNGLAGNFEGGLKTNNDGTLQAIYAFKSMGTGNVAKFENNSVSNSDPAVEIKNDGGGAGISVSVTGSGKGISVAGDNNTAIFASSANTAGLSAIEATNGGNGGVIKAYTGLTATGVVADFSNASTANTSNVLVVNQAGSGVVVKSTVSTSAPMSGSNLSFLAENGHIGSANTSATNVTANATCTTCAIPTLTVEVYSTDVAGTLSAAFTSTPAVNVDINVTFVRPYKNYPVVTITPAQIPNFNGALNYVAVPIGSAGNYTGFKLTLIQNCINLASTYKFNYMVIEGRN